MSEPASRRSGAASRRPGPEERGEAAVVAVDVGGTSMKGAVVDGAGRLLWADSRDTAHPGPDAAVAGILDYAADLAKQAAEATGRPPVAAGLAVPGVVDSGLARYATNLGWHDVPLRDLAAASLGIPVVLGHDVRTGALAEARFGAARGVDDFLYLPIGTGIAGALFLRGEPYPGATARGGELGHAPVRPDGEVCACGQRGCLEAYASAAAVARRYAARGGTPGLSTPDIVALAAAGDPVAAAVWGEAVGALATALASYTMVLDPVLVVVGGGLADAGDALLGPLRGRLAALLAWREPPRVVRGALGSSAGPLGAAVLAWRAVGHEVRPASGPDAPPAGVAGPQVAGRGDAGPDDAGRGDAGRGDAGPGDAGRRDAGRGDAERGNGVRAGLGDAGRGGAGRGEAGRGEAGRGDAGRGDAGSGGAGGGCAG